MTMVWDGVQLIEALRAAAQRLNRYMALLNQINVFPVPDGDTGTNMVRTIDALVSELTPNISCGVVATQIAQRALMHGRGNSGIIMAQALTGFGRALGDTKQLTGADIARALQAAAVAAYAAVANPVEGTILSALQEAGAAAVQAIAEAADTTVADVLDAAVAAARTAVEQSPAHLPALREAGVVDAGALGLVLLLEGMRGAARGKVEADMSLFAAPRLPLVAEEIGYCVNFTMRGALVEREVLVAAWAAIGDSLVVAGDAAAMRVHLHTVNPGDALSTGLRFGTLEAIEIQNMVQQCRARQAPTSGQTRVGVVALSHGTGFAQIFRDLGATIATETGIGAAASILAAIVERSEQEIVILPNDPGLFAAAEIAAHLSGRAVAVVPTISAAHGVAALLALSERADLHFAAAAMTSAANSVAVAAIAANGGRYLGLIGGALVAQGTALAPVATALLEYLPLAERELVTIYTGCDATAGEAEALTAQIASAHSDVTIEMLDGGQALFHFLIAVE